MQQALIYHKLVSILGAENVRRDVSMKEHTSIRTGGPVDFFAEPDRMDRLAVLIHTLKENDIPFCIIGNCSNLIVADEGFRGVFIRIGPRLSEITVAGETIRVQAGASLAAVSARACEEGLAGMEFASGIPGTVGGAAFMNAGAYDGEMSQVITKTINLDRDGHAVVLSGHEHDFGYRHSRIMDWGLIVTEVHLVLKKGDPTEIRNKMTELNGRRRDRQPLNLPSAGSVFKRPEGFFAGKLIEDCGLKGLTLGGAQVSAKHCGFIVNTGNATSSDVIGLIEMVRERVLKETGVLLEPEVRIIGGFEKCSS